jgi:hypothetical protein
VRLLFSLGVCSSLSRFFPDPPGEKCRGLKKKKEGKKERKVKKGLEDGMGVNECNERSQEKNNISSLHRRSQGSTRSLIFFFDPHASPTQSNSRTKKKNRRALRPFKSIHPPHGSACLIHAPPQLSCPREFAPLLGDAYWLTVSF